MDHGDEQGLRLSHTYDQATPRAMVRGVEHGATAGAGPGRKQDGLGLRDLHLLGMDRRPVAYRTASVQVPQHGPFPYGRDAEIAQPAELPSDGKPVVGVCGLLDSKDDPLGLVGQHLAGRLSCFAPECQIGVDGNHPHGKAHEQHEREHHPRLRGCPLWDDQVGELGEPAHGMSSGRDLRVVERRPLRHGRGAVEPVVTLVLLVLPRGFP